MNVLMKSSVPTVNTKRFYTVNDNRVKAVYTEKPVNQGEPLDLDLTKILTALVNHEMIGYDA